MKIVFVSYEDYRSEDSFLEELTELLNQNKQLRTPTILHFNEASKAYHYIVQNEVSLIFIDIDSQTSSHFEFAKQIKQTCALAYVVFISKTPDHAVEAFNINIIDYLLKPVKKERLYQTLSKCEIIQQNIKRISLFKDIVFYKNELPLEISWRTAKAKEIFTFLLLRQNEEIKKDYLIDNFFSDLDMKNAFDLLYTTIHQIRKLLKQIEFDISIISKNNAYKLVMNEIVLDINEWDRIINEPYTYSNWSGLLDLYKGPLLENEGYLWAKPEQINYHLQWKNVLETLTEHLINTKQYHRALALNYKAKSISSFDEEIYFSIIKLLDLLNYDNLVKEEFINLQTMMKKEYDSEPNAEIIQWIQSRN